MRLLMLLFVVAMLGIPAQVSAQGIGALFSPVPKPAAGTLSAQKKWKMRAEVAVPAFKIVESRRENAETDVFLFSSAGGGLSYQQIEFDAANQRWSTRWHFSVPTVLLSGNLAASENPIDLSLMASAGYGSVLIGVGYDLGEVVDRSRWFLGFSLAFANNN